MSDAIVHKTRLVTFYKRKRPGTPAHPIFHGECTCGAKTSETLVSGMVSSWLYDHAHDNNTH